MDSRSQISPDFVSFSNILLLRLATDSLADISLRAARNQTSVQSGHVQKNAHDDTRAYHRADTNPTSNLTFLFRSKDTCQLLPWTFLRQKYDLNTSYARFSTETAVPLWADSCCLFCDTVPQSGFMFRPLREPANRTNDRPPA